MIKFQFLLQDKKNSLFFCFREKMEELKLQLLAAQRIQDDLYITFNQTQCK